jgi:hypothetical protein
MSYVNGVRQGLITKDQVFHSTSTQIDYRMQTNIEQLRGQILHNDIEIKKLRKENESLDKVVTTYYKQIEVKDTEIAELKTVVADLQKKYDDYVATVMDDLYNPQGEGFKLAQKRFEAVAQIAEDSGVGSLDAKKISRKLYRMFEIHVYYDPDPEDVDEDDNWLQTCGRIIDWYENKLPKDLSVFVQQEEQEYENRTVFRLMPRTAEDQEELAEEINDRFESDDDCIIETPWTWCNYFGEQKYPN